jgi:hypothetical protein
LGIGDNKEGVWHKGRKFEKFVMSLAKAKKRA